MDLSIAALRADQVEAAARFLESQQAGGLARDEWLEKFRIFWDHNPFFDESRHPRGWVITDPSGAILGFLGNIPVRYVQNGVEVPCYWATTWFVAEKARTRSLDLFRQFMTQQGVLFDTTPTPEVELIISRRLKYSRLDAEWIGKDYLLPIHLGALVKLVQWRLRGIPLLKPLGLPACLAIKAASWCLSFGGGLKSEPTVTVRRADVLPDDLDAWWNAYRTRASFTLVRDRRAIGWLFQAGSFARSRAVFEVRKDAALLGFVCLKLVRQPDFAFVEMVDLALLETSQDVLRTVIVELKTAVSSWADDIAYLQVNALASTMAGLLPRAGFGMRQGRARYYYFDRTKSLSSAEIYGTPADGDRSLFP